MFAQLVSTYHLHPIVDHFTIALLTLGIAAELLSAAAILISRNGAGFLSAWGQKLRSASLLLMIAGAGRQRPLILQRRRGSRSALGPDVAGRAADSFVLQRRCLLYVPCGAGPVPDVRVFDSRRLASDARVIAEARTPANRVPGCGDSPRL